MRVLLLSDAGSPHTYRWAKGLSESGAEVAVLSITPPSESLKRLGDLKIYSLNMVVRGWSKLRKLTYLRAIPLLKRVMREFSPQVVNAHYISSYGLIAVLGGVKPLVLSAWGGDVSVFPHKSPLHEKAIRFILSRADAITASSEYLKQLVREFTSKEVHRIYFGIDLNLFKPAPKTSPIFTVGTAKLLKDKYGQDVLLRGFKLFIERQSLAPVEARLLIVGGGERGETLRRLAEELKVSQYVTFTGWVEYQEVPRYMKEMDVVVLTSRQEELGVAAIEGSAMGKPVIATEVGGLREVVLDGITGFLIPPESPEALADKLEALFLKPSLREELGRSGRRRAEELFDLRDSVNQMLKVFKEVISDET